MRPLVIDREVRALIATAITSARQHITPLDFVMQHALPDKPMITLEDKTASGNIHAIDGMTFQSGYSVFFSFEQQPSGLCRHLSISVDKAGLLPNQKAVKMIADEFGMDIKHWIGSWIEEFDPGEMAINVLAVVPNDQS